MTEDIIEMARDAGFVIDEKAQQHQPNCIFHTYHMIDEQLKRFATLVAAAERKRMISDGWRQCAEGQRTSQHCAVAEQARRDEREACAKLIESRKTGANELMDAVRDMEARAIRARGAHER
jgi:hypothetical protein